MSQCACFASLFLKEDNNREEFTRLAHACRERKTFRTRMKKSNLGRKTHVVVDFKHLSRFEWVDDKDRKNKKRSHTYLGIPSIARSTPAMILYRERQRALLRLRLRSVAARDDAEFFCCFCLFFSRDCKEEDKTLLKARCRAVALCGFQEARREEACDVLWCTL